MSGIGRRRVAGARRADRQDPLRARRWKRDPWRGPR